MKQYLFARVAVANVELDGDEFFFLPLETVNIDRWAQQMEKADPEASYVAYDTTSDALIERVDTEIVGEADVRVGNGLSTYGRIHADFIERIMYPATKTVYFAAEAVGDDWHTRWESAPFTLEELRALIEDAQNGDDL